MTSTHPSTLSIPSTRLSEEPQKSLNRLLGDADNIISHMVDAKSKGMTQRPIEDYASQMHDIVDVMKAYLSPSSASLSDTIARYESRWAHARF